MQASSALITINDYPTGQVILFVFRLFLLPLIALLGATACTSHPPRPQSPQVDVLAEAAQPLIERGDYPAAAQLYLSAAKTAPENLRIDRRLQAARLLAKGLRWARLEQVLSSMPAADSLKPPQASRYRLLAAQLAMVQKQPEDALNLLAGITSPESFADHGRQYYQLRADAYARNGNALEAARQLIWLDGLIEDPAQKLDNQYRIWEQLSSLSDEALQALKTAPPPDALSGWMELVLLTRTYRGDRDHWSGELERWRTRYPRHAAEDALLPDLFRQVGQFVSPAKQIAVLLPLSGHAADAADAIRDGILAALFHSSSPRPVLRIYNTGGRAQPVLSLYQQAINDGADFVIGPLLKDGIQTLLQSGQLPVPVLALNHITDTLEDSDLPLYQFGLAPEDEARQAATRMIADGHQRLIALLPQSAWGERVFAAFQQRLTELGGEVLSAERYKTRGSDFTGPIQHALNLDASKQRHRILQRLLGEKLSFEPRRRQDAQAVFILAFPRQARQIKPQLRFHHAGELPVYSTSHVYQASEDPAIDRDMDGLMFCDIPWVLDQDGPWAAQRQQIQDIWPDRGRRYQRLFALGYDAYQIIPWLTTLQRPGFTRFPGATGILSLDADKQLHRVLEWAHFIKGHATIIPNALITSTEGQHEQENDR